MLQITIEIVDLVVNTSLEIHVMDRVKAGICVGH